MCYYNPDVGAERASFIGYIGKSSSAVWELKSLVASRVDFVIAASIIYDISYRFYVLCNSPCNLLVRETCTLKKEIKF